MSNFERWISVGIDPAGIGTSGVVIKTYGSLYPYKWSKSIMATNPVDAANAIINFINQKKSFLANKDFDLKQVVVELPHGGAETRKEVKATRELVGILRYYYEGKFKGHLPNHKDKDFLVSLKKDKRSSHEHDAESILFAHFKEMEKGYQCENFRWGVTKYAKNR